MLRFIRLTTLTGAVAAALAVPAIALAAGDTPRVFFVGAFGGAFGHTGDGVAAAGVTAAVTPHLQIRGEFGRMQNVMPAATTDVLTGLAASLGDASTVTWDARMPANYGSGTARVLARRMGRFTPFAEGGGGFAHMSTEITAEVLGADETAAFQSAAGAPESGTKPLLMVGGGVSIATSRRSAVDVAYRYDHIYADNAIGTNRLLASLRVGF